MIFKFAETHPKAKMKEFGNKEWVDRNVNRLIAQSAILFILAIMTGAPFIYLWSLLPLITLMFVSDWLKIALVVQSFWYFPILIWQARNEPV